MRILRLSELFFFLIPCYVHALSDAELLPLVESQNIPAIKIVGQEVMPQLAKLYSSSNQQNRTKIASIFYGLGWKSEEAKSVLMKDVKTEDRALRLQVQWALGRVSNDEEVVTKLLDNMRNDPNPLFRDKAACALASDQIHLTDKQKGKLYEGVIGALSDDKDDVRRIAGLVLKIQTGQTKGYNAMSSLAERESSIAAWKMWLEEYRKSVTDE